MRKQAKQFIVIAAYVGIAVCGLAFLGNNREYEHGRCESLQLSCGR